MPLCKIIDGFIPVIYDMGDTSLEIYYYDHKFVINS